jgi:hypothetical protein
MPEPTRECAGEPLCTQLADRGLDAEKLGPQLDSRVYSGFLRARKPLTNGDLR